MRGERRLARDLGSGHSADLRAQCWVRSEGSVPLLLERALRASAPLTWVRVPGWGSALGAQGLFSSHSLLGDPAPIVTTRKESRMLEPLHPPGLEETPLWLGQVRTTGPGPSG